MSAPIMALPAAMELAAPEKIQSMKKELMTKTTPTSIHASGRKAWSWSVMRIVIVRATRARLLVRVLLA